MPPKNPNDIDPDSKLIEDAEAEFLNKQGTAKKGYEGVLAAYQELADSLQLILAIKKDTEKLDAKELRGLVKQVALMERYVTLEQSAYNLTKKAIELQGKSDAQKRNERGYERGKALSRFYRADRPHQLGMIVGKAVDLFGDKNRGHRDVDPFDDGKKGMKSKLGPKPQGGAGGGGAIRSVFGVVGKLFTGVVDGAKKAVMAVATGGTSAAAGTAAKGATQGTAAKGATQGVAGKEQAAIEKGVAQANKEAVDSTPSAGDAIGEQMAGLAGTFGDALGILDTLVSVTTKIWKAVEQASPYLAGMMKLIAKAVNLFLMPIGNIIATILRPFAVRMMQKSADALSKVGELGDITALNDTIVSDVLTPMFEEMAAIFIKITWNILPSLVYGFMVALLNGIAQFMGNQLFGGMSNNSAPTQAELDAARKAQGGGIKFSSEQEKATTSIFDQLIKVFANIGEVVVQTVVANLTFIGEIFDSIVTASTNFIAKNVGDLIKIITGIVDSVLSFFTKNLSDLSKIITGLVDQVLSWFTTNINQLIGMLTGFVNQFLSWLSSNINVLVGFLTSIVSEIGKWMGEHVGELATFLTNIVNIMSQWITEHVGEIVGFLNGIVTAITNWINGSEGTAAIKEAIKEILGAMVGAFLGVFNILGRGDPGLSQSEVDAARDKVNGIGVTPTAYSGSGAPTAENLAYVKANMPESSLTKTISNSTGSTTTKAVNAVNTAAGTAYKAERFLAAGDAHFSPFSPRSVIIGEGSQGESVLTDPQLVGVINKALSAGLSAAKNTQASSKAERSSGGTVINVNFNAPVYGEKEFEKQVRALVNRINRESGWI